MKNKNKVINFDRLLIFVLLISLCVALRINDSSSNDYIDEEDLYGYWTSIDADNNVYGFQFQHSDDFGPHTVVRISMKEDGYDVTEIGYYSINNKTNNLEFWVKQEITSDNKVLQKSIYDVYTLSIKNNKYQLTKDDIILDLEKVIEE